MFTLPGCIKEHTTFWNFNTPLLNHSTYYFDDRILWQPSKSTLKTKIQALRCKNLDKLQQSDCDITRNDGEFYGFKYTTLYIYMYIHNYPQMAERFNRTELSISCNLYWQAVRPTMWRLNRIGASDALAFWRTRTGSISQRDWKLFDERGRERVSTS